MAELDLVPSSLREWLAAVGLLRLVTETTETGRLQWRNERGRYRLFIEDMPDHYCPESVARPFRQ